MTVPLAFCAVVPVKRVQAAKSRLAALGREPREALAAAFALDTVEVAAAATSVGVVVVVTDDDEVGRLARALGVEVWPDPSPGDLNAALVRAAADARSRWPDLAPAALCADLPALRAEHLDAALARAADFDTAFVPDAAGIGTTLFAARSARGFTPRFGHGSREAHLDLGAHELADVPAGLRRDVDTPRDLAAAAELGVGPRTRRLLASGAASTAARV